MLIIKPHSYYYYLHYSLPDFYSTPCSLLTRRSSSINNLKSFEIVTWIIVRINIYYYFFFHYIIVDSIITLRLFYILWSEVMSLYIPLFSIHAAAEEKYMNIVLKLIKKQQFKNDYKNYDEISNSVYFVLYKFQQQLSSI